MAKALTHIALHTRDREKSVQFYKDWCGMVDASPDLSQKSPWLSTPGKEGTFALVLVPTAKNEHVQPLIDVTRLGFAVESRELLWDLYKQAVDANIVERPYEPNPTETRANFRVKDPDGFLIEFWYAENPPLVRTFNNMSLHVRDMNVARDFYQEWCDMEVLYYGQVSKSCRVVTPKQANPFQIVLCDGAIKPSIADKSDISHVGIAVETVDELQVLFERAQRANIVAFSLHTRPYPAGSLFIIKDPDNRNVEFSYGQPLGQNFPKPVR